MWEKRFWATHYSYRDFTQATPMVLTADMALALYAAGNTSVFYNFGANARLVSVYNWPNIGDFIFARQCYAREVFVYSEAEAYIRFVCLNPEYVREATVAARTGAAVVAPQVIVENERRIPAFADRRYFLTYGIAIIFRTPAGEIPGVLDIDVEGNVEGGE